MRDLFEASEEFERQKQREAEYLNSQGVENPDCPLCKGRGVHYVARGRYLFVRYCVCREKKKTAARMAASGLTQRLRMCTFSAFVVGGRWQKEMREMALSFIEKTKKRLPKEAGEGGPPKTAQKGEDPYWFYIGGQVGCGKTHLCTAILNELIEAGYACRYVVWPDEADALKGNAEGYVQRLQKLCDAEVLYIDDFLKAPEGAAPTPGEMTAAIKLLNRRYLQGDKVTILSSEWYMQEMMQLDAGLGSRVFERCGPFRLEVGRDQKKNMRL